MMNFLYGYKNADENIDDAFHPIRVNVELTRSQYMGFMEIT